jgi:Family of unknown function (DUF5829)
MKTHLFTILLMATAVLLVSGTVAQAQVPMKLDSHGGTYAPLPPVLLNNVYIVLEANTYNAIINSDFIKSNFVGGGERTVTANTSWTGAYFFGQETYIEFYNPEKNIDPHNKVVSNSGVIFDIEQEGGSATLQYALKRTDSAFAATTATVLFPRKIGASATNIKVPNTPEKEVSWAYFTTSRYQNQTQRRFKSWTMEYHPKYLQNAYPDGKPAENGITRRQYLARQYDSTKLVRNITAVCIALDSVEKSRFIRELKASGYAVQEGKRETNAMGNNCTFRIIPATASKQGIIELRMMLNRSIPHQLYTFGEHSTLMLDEQEAVWTF